MLRQIFAVAGNTFTESLRQPIFLVLLLGGLLLLAFTPPLTGFTLEEDNKLLADLGLNTLFLAGLVLAAFTATSAVTREIENKTVLAVVSKPVHRATFIVGKYLGVTGALGVASWNWALAYLLAVRHGVLSTASTPIDWPVIESGCGAILLATLFAAAANYLYSWSFSTVFTWTLSPLLFLAYLLILCHNKDWGVQPIGTDAQPQLYAAIVLCLLGLALLAAVAIAASTRLGPSLTLALCMGVFVLGLSSDYLFGRYAETSLLCRFLHAVVPNLQYFSLSDALTQDAPISANYVLHAAGYGLLYILALLGAAVALFQTREVG